MAARSDPTGESIRIVPAPLFIATKLEAFETRGKGDFLLSSDLEDVVSVLNGRPGIVEETWASDEDVKVYLSQRYRSQKAKKGAAEATP